MCYQLWSETNCMLTWYWIILAKQTFGPGQRQACAYRWYCGMQLLLNEGFDRPFDLKHKQIIASHIKWYGDNIHYKGFFDKVYLWNIHWGWCGVKLEISSISIPNHVIKWSYLPTNGKWPRLLNRITWRLISLEGCAIPFKCRSSFEWKIWEYPVDNTIRKTDVFMEVFMGIELYVIAALT